jgi:hypothetical protein
VALAPAQHFPAAKTRAGPQRDSHRGPRRAQPGAEQFGQRPRAARRVRIAAAQIRAEQALAAKHVERQEAPVAVAGLEGVTFLHPVHAIIGRVEIEHQFLRRLRVGWR